MDTHTDFVPGITLCADFYREAVRPLLDAHFPGLKHAAALIGNGSEVLGFDDPTSTDHDWGPRLLLFVEPEALSATERIRQTLAQLLPKTFHGYPTNFSPPDPADGGTQLLQALASGPVNHRVTVHSVRDFFAGYLGFEISLPLEPADWLSFPEQRLRAITAGAVYHDEVGLEQTRKRFAYYPHDVWLYLLAAGWTRLGQEEHLMGRAGMVGDEAGSALIGARLVRDIMRLCFLMAKTYAPYPKWLGSAFECLPCATELLPVLEAALHASHWQKRETNLVKAYEHLAVQHNALGITEALPEQTMRFFGRPLQVIALHGFAEALVQRIEDPLVRRIAARPLIGGLDMLSDNTDFTANPFWRPLIRQLYQEPLEHQEKDCSA